MRARLYHLAALAGVAALVVSIRLGLEGQDLEAAIMFAAGLLCCAAWAIADAVAVGQWGEE